MTKVLELRRAGGPESSCSKKPLIGPLAPDAPAITDVIQTIDLLVDQLKRIADEIDAASHVARASETAKKRAVISYGLQLSILNHKKMLLHIDASDAED